MTSDDRALVARLWQLYSHDMADVRGTLPNRQGLYRVGRLPSYYDNPDCAGSVITHQGSPVGIAFVYGLTDATRKMGDFFVVRGARRLGLGYAAARALLAQYPGSWEIGFQVENVGAPEFWRRVVTDTVGADWREEERPVPGKPHIPDDHFLVFDSPAR
jgi:predicted acetyltransferase